MKKLAILGEFNPASETHAATNTAIEHSKKLLEIDLDVSWISTEDISENLLKHFHGFFGSAWQLVTGFLQVIMNIDIAEQTSVPDAQS